MGTDKKQITNATKRYHDEYYNGNKLFSKGSWLEKSEDTIINIAKKYLIGKTKTRVLDLGAGVGRNAIPIAQIIGSNKGKVVCVDYLETATQKLTNYAQDYRVSECIECHTTPIEDYIIKENYFDFIIAHSVLEHVRDKTSFLQTINKIIEGTKRGGLNYLYISTNQEDHNVSAGRHTKGQIEVILEFEPTKKLLAKLYHGWKIIELSKNPYRERYSKNGDDMEWRVDYLRLVAQKLTS